MIAPGPDSQSSVRRLFQVPAGTEGPTVGRILLGAGLRRARNDKKLSQHTAGQTIRATGSKISRMESGQVGFKKRDVLDLLDLYEVRDEQERARLLGLINQTNASGWWHRYGDLLQEGVETYLDLEQAASMVRIYHPWMVPSLLQTEAYAQAALRLSHPDETDNRIDQRVELCLMRQGLLKRADPKVLVVVDESALRRLLGGAAVLREQIQHLADLAELNYVTLRVVPPPGLPVVGGPFTVLRFTEPDLPDVVHIEQLSSALYLDKRSDVEQYTAVVERLSAQATASGSREIIRSVLKDL